MKILNNLDLVKNELQNARVQNLASAPSSPVEGQIYHNTSDHYLYYYDGTAWVKIDDAWVSSVSGTAPIQSTGGATPTISIDAATTSAAGSMSASDKTKLDDATADATAGKLVIRDGAGQAKFDTPTDASHVATKAYVDSFVQGLDTKASVRLATTGSNITLSNSTTTLDGQTIVDGDRILVKDQTDATENGIYDASTSGSWSRSSDADGNSEVTPGLFVFVEEGTNNGDNGYVLTTDGTITLGSTDIVFQQFSGAGQITAGDGLTKTGNTIDVVGTANRITVNANDVDIASTYVGQSSITTLGTISTGTWEATDVGVAHGGTGASTAADARQNLGAASTVTASITGASTTQTVTHNLNTRDIIVQVYETASPYAQVFPDIELSTVNAVDIVFATAPGSTTYRVVVMGVQN
jgi:hypothetical protein